MLGKTPPPKVAVCMAAYNGIRWLDQQIESILRQSDVSITLYVSVDLSSDGTDKYFTKLSATNSRVVLLPYGERFGGAAKNFFRLLTDIDFSNYQYVALADQDDIWHADKVSRAISTLERSNAVGYSSNVTAFWENGRKTLIDKAQPQREWDFLFESAGPGCTYVFRSELAGRIKECLTKNYEETGNIGLHDWFIYAFARANGYKWVIDSLPSMLYRQHSYNQVGANQGIRAYIFRARTVLSGWGLQQAYLIARTVGLGSNPFVVRWKKMGRKEMIWLALQAAKCRRRVRDRFLFGVSCVGLAICGTGR